MTRSAPSRSESNAMASSTISIPAVSLAFKKALKAPPNPPAAPAPLRGTMSVWNCPAITRAKERMPRSRASAVWGSAPFWGAKTRAAPSGPQKGVLTSQATINSDSRAAGIRDDMSIRAMDSKSLPQPFSLCPRLSRNLTPNAESMPVPASLVALPPIPTRNLRHPLFSASEIISPVPYVEVIHGFSSSGSRSGSPLAADISITAVFTPPDLTMP